MYDSNTISLAPNVLKSYAEQWGTSGAFEISTREFSIFNDSVERIVSAINSLSPDVVGFSAYIWNINEILEITGQIDAITIVGGPQVTGIEEKLLRENPGLDIVATGEGEETIRELLEHFAGKRSLESICGITTREFKGSPRAVLQDLDAIPSVYDRVFAETPGLSWITLETSRGCPYQCRFCTWSYSKKIRYYSLDRVIRDLERILAQESVKNIYLSDSSLLINKERAKRILQHIVDSGTNKPMRFEFCAEQMDDEIIALLSQLPGDDFNLGVQTVNEKALKETGRRFDRAKFEENYRKLGSRLRDGSQITVDLIYGLPGDDIEGFKSSLDYVMSLDHVSRILTNPLIALPGSQFFREMDKYGITLRDDKSYLVKECATFTGEQMDLARKYSFFVSLIYLNRSLTHCVKAFARDLKRRCIDTVIEFMESLPEALRAHEYPDMIPSIREGFRQRNIAFERVIQLYDDIIQEFDEYSMNRYTAVLKDYRHHFSDQYYKIMRFVSDERPS